jgi:hypothetical protein
MTTLQRLQQEMKESLLEFKSQTKYEETMRKMALYEQAALFSFSALAPDVSAATAASATSAPGKVCDLLEYALTWMTLLS